jgi:hypothetical protein
MARRTLAGLGAVLCLGAMTPNLANATTELKLVGGPVALGGQVPFPGYQLVVAAALRPRKVVLAVELLRPARGGIQEEYFAFQLPRSALRISSGLAHAQLDTHSALAQFGRIRMTFSCRGVTPPSFTGSADARATCLGSARHRAGTLTGSFDLRTDVGVRIRQSTLPATLSVAPLPLSRRRPGVSVADGQPVLGSANSCGLDPGTRALTVTRDFGRVTFVGGEQRRGPGALTAVIVRRRPPAGELAVVESTGPRSFLRAAGLKRADLSSAHFAFMSGSLGFSGARPVPGCPRRAAFGTAIGTLAAHFDFLGTVRAIRAGSSTDAILSVRPLG